MHRCSKCGRFVKRIREATGLPLSTGFPPDRPMFASSMPYAPFICSHHSDGVFSFGSVEYQQVQLGGDNG